MKRFAAVSLLLIIATLPAHARVHKSLDRIDGVFASPPTETVAVMVRHVGSHAPVSSAEVASIGAIHVKTYDAFTVARIPATARNDIAGSARAHGLRVNVEEDWDTLSMPNYRLDTRAPVLPAEPRSVTQDGRGLFVVQFASPIDHEYEEVINGPGVMYLSYIPYNGALIFTSSGIAEIIGRQPGVQWVSPYYPAFRDQPMSYPAEKRPLAVQVVKAAGNTTVLSELAAENGETPATTEYENDIVVRLNGSGSLAKSLIQNPYVIAVEYTGTPQPSGERDAIAGTSTTVSTVEPYEDQTRPYKPAGTYKTWLTNRGMLDTSTYRIAFCDTGLDPTLVDIARTDIVQKTYVGGTQADYGGHGSAVVGVALGNPAGQSLDPANFYWAMGSAPLTKIYAQQIIGGNNTPGPVRTWADDARILGCTVQTHSHSSYRDAVAGAYTLESRDYDIAVRDTYGPDDGIDTPMPMTAAAGNICGGASKFDDPLWADCTTKVLSPATAKNVLTVGGSESWRPTPIYSICRDDSKVRRQPGDYKADSFKNVAYISRRGTLDGRNKPDIIAPATMVSTITSNPLGFCLNPSGNYIIDTGTSFSAPQAAAAYVLLRKKRGMTLSPAMLKAAIIGNAISVKGGLDRYTSTVVGARPNSVQGYGRLYLGNALATSGVTQTYLDEASWTPFTGAGQSRTRQFTIPDVTKQAIIVLAWTDEPGAGGTNPSLVRNLDAEIFFNYCYGYTGNMMDGNEQSLLQGIYSCGSFAYDQSNNVEMIVVPPNSFSTFSLSVYATTWGGGTHNQKFAVFASNAY
jgi:Subtilase family